MCLNECGDATKSLILMINNNHKIQVDSRCGGGGCSPQKNQKKTSQFTNFGVATGFFLGFLGCFLFFWVSTPLPQILFKRN